MSLARRVAGLTSLTSPVLVLVLAGCAADAPVGEAQLGVSVPPSPTALQLDGTDVVAVGACSPWTVTSVRSTSSGPTATNVLVNLAVAIQATGTAGLFADSSCLSALAGTTTIAAGQNSATFWVGAVDATRGTLTASAANLEGAQADYVIAVPGTPKYAIAEIGPTLIGVGACVRYTVSLFDANFLQVVALSPTAVLFTFDQASKTSSYQGFTIYSDKTCSIVSNQKTIPQGKGSAAFWLKASAPGTHERSAFIVATGQYAGTPAVTARAPTHISLSGPAGISPGQCKPYTVLAQDDAGDDAPVGADTAVSFSKAGKGVFYSDSGCATAITSTTIVANKAQRTFYFQDAKVEQVTLSATSALGSASLAVAIAVPSKLKLAGDAAVVVPGCGAYTVTLQASIHNQDVAVPSAQDVVVNLSSSVAGGTFYAGASCLAGKETAQVTVPAGSTQVPLSYRPPALPAGSFLGATLTAAASGLTGDALSVALTTPTTVTALRLSTTSPSSDHANACLPIDIVAVDASGNPAGLPASTSVKLTGLGSGIVYTDPACTIAAQGSRVPMAVGTSAKTFWFKDVAIESLTLTATGDVTNGTDTLTLKGTRDLALHGELTIDSFTPVRQYLCRAQTMRVVDLDGTTISTHPGLTATLTVPYGMSVYEGTSCAGSPVTQLTIPANSGGTSFSVRTQSPSDQVLMASSSSPLVYPGGGIFAIVPLIDASFREPAVFVESGDVVEVHLDGVWADGYQEVPAGDAQLSSADPLDLNGTTVTVGGAAGEADVLITPFGQVQVGLLIEVFFVGPPVSAYVSSDPQPVSLTAGETRALQYIGSWSGSVWLYTEPSPAAWTSDNTAVATVDAAGVVTAVGPGQATITGVFKGVPASIPVTVQGAASLDIQPAALYLPLGEGDTFDAIADIAGDVSQQAVWTSSDPSVATVQTGVVTGVGIGTAEITATWGGASFTAPVTVGPAEVASLAIQPFDKLLVGGAAAVQVTATYTDGSTANVSTQVDWTSSAPTIAYVSSASRRVVGRALGTATLTASLDGVSATATAEVWTLQVTEVPNGQVIDPTTTKLSSIGAVQQLQTILAPPPGVAPNASPSVSWSVECSLNGSNLAGPCDVGHFAGDTVVGDSAGGALMRARVSGYAGSAFRGLTVGNVTATPASFAFMNESGTVVQSSATIRQGELIQLRFRLGVSFSYGGGSRVIYIDTPSLPWLSQNPTSALSLGLGWFAGLKSSTTAVQVGVQSPFGNLLVPLTTQAPAATRVVIKPAFARLPLGSQLQQSATVRYADASTADVTNLATWSAADSTLTVTASGDVTGNAAGTSAALATYAGVTGSARRDVWPFALHDLKVLPAQVIATGRKPVQLTAIGVLWDNGPAHVVDLTAQADWSSTDSKVVVGSLPGERGLAHGISPDVGVDAFVIAAIRGLSAMSWAVDFQVTPASLWTITVATTSVSGDSLPTYNLTATATWSDGQADTIVTQTATWASSGPAVQIQSQSPGVAKCVAPGQATVSASQENQTGSIVITCGPTPP